MTVRRTFSPDGHGRLAERSTKGGKSRQVPIIEELTPWLDRARELGFDHVFTGKRGGPFDSGGTRRPLARPARPDRDVRRRESVALSRSPSHVPIPPRAPRHRSRAHSAGRRALRRSRRPSGTPTWRQALRPRWQSATQSTARIVRSHSEGVTARLTRVTHEKPPEIRGFRSVAGAGLEPATSRL